MTAKNSSQLSVVSDLSKATAVREIEIDRLMVSAEETRKTIGYTALEDLAASIRTHGVQEPLLVRIIGGLAGPFEIVAGQRRWLASKIAGKTTCPCIVREMSDAEAAELRIISNLQREDLPPLEEALAFSALLNAPGATVETVAAKLAKSPSYVGRRLKLLDAIEPVREALKAGAIEVGHALELARLDEKQQIRHLSRLNCGYITSAAENNRFACEDDEEFDEDDDLDGAEDVFNEDEDGEAPERPEPVGAKQSQWKPTDASVAELRREIARTTLRVLSKAPFPLGDELPPMACTECPKRSGNAALLFDDCAQDTCTDRDCFDAKVKVWIKYELDQADKDKRKLLMLSDGYSSSHAAIPHYDVTVIDGQKRVACEHQEEAIWISGNQTGHRAMICRNPACKQHKSRNVSSLKPVDPVKAKAERKKLLAKVKAEKTYRAVLFKTIAATPGPALQKAFDRVVTEIANYAVRRSDSTKYAALGEATGIPKEALTRWKTEDSFAELAKRPPHVRALIGWLAIHDSELTVHESDVPGGGALNKARKIDLEEIADVVGVDWKALRKTHAPEPEAKKPAPKKSPAKKTLAKTTPKKAAKKVVAKAAKKGGTK
jgi:ParB/RepB/Spo0J family partition protein